MSVALLNSIPKQTKAIGQFGGINQKLSCGDSEFSDMKNISGRQFPVLTTRKPRGTQGNALTKPNGLFWKNGLFVVDGTQCTFNGTAVSGLTVADSKKTLVGMGAYICIFPDKILFNTSDRSFTAMGATLSGVSVTVQPLSTGSSFAKITASGIDRFSVNDNVTFSGFSGDLANLNGQTKIITDAGNGYIVVSYLANGTKTQSTGAVLERKIPDMDFVCEHENRLWGCSSSNHEIYASKLGDPKNWNNFEGIASDSYAASVGSDGDFTGCISHLGYVVFFKEQYIHVMYGSKPSNFQLNSKQLPGVKAGCEESLEIVNETLFYVGVDGVYAYDGAFPTKISDNITESITEAVASQEDGVLYVSCKLGGIQTILTYDKGVWRKEDDDKFMFASYGDGKLHYIDKDKKVTTISGSRNETIGWFIESGDRVEGSLDNKYISKLKFNVRLNGEMTVYMKYDDGEWKRCGSVITPRNTTYVFPIIPMRCNKFRYRIEGSGQFELFGTSVEIEGGNEYVGSSVGF